MDGGLDGWRVWRARLDGSEMRFGSRGSILCVGSVVRGFCGSQGWTVPGVSVPVCGSVRGLPVKQGKHFAGLLRFLFSTFAYWNEKLGIPVLDI